MPPIRNLYRTGNTTSFLGIRVGFGGEHVSSRTEQAAGERRRSVVTVRGPKSCTRRVERCGCLLYRTEEKCIVCSPNEGTHCAGKYYLGARMWALFLRLLAFFHSFLLRGGAITQGGKHFGKRITSAYC